MTEVNEERRAFAATRVVTGQLHRVQRGHGKRFVAEPPPGPVRRPARVALMVALAHKIQQAIDRGDVRDRAEVARRLSFTRARITPSRPWPTLVDCNLRLCCMNGSQDVRLGVKRDPPLHIRSREEQAR